MTRKVESLLPELIRSFYSGNDKDVESIIISMIRLLSASGDKSDLKISEKMSQILKEYRSGILDGKNTLRSGKSERLDSKYFQQAIPNIDLNGLTLTTEVTDQIDNVISSQRNADKLKELNILPIKRVLINGRPGTGKSSIAAAIAQELGIDLLIVRVTNLFSSYMGDSGKNLITAFDELKNENAVILFDEFDSIATSRSLTNDLGEMRRIVNTILTILDHWDGNGLLIATTNETAKLDDAIWRRFDEIIHVELPSNQMRLNIWSQYTQNKLSRAQLDMISKISEGYSPSDIENISQQGLRSMVLRKLPLFESLITILGKNVIDPKDREYVTKLLKSENSKLTTREIANILNVSKSTVQRYLNKID